jgi:predicted ester cyclase
MWRFGRINPRNRVHRRASTIAYRSTLGRVTPAAVARAYLEYFNERRLDESGQRFVHPQATYHYVPTNQRLVGRAGHRALAATWLVAFDDARADIVNLTAIDEDTVAVDFLGSGTHTGELTFWEGKSLPPTGRRAEVMFRYTLTVKNDLIVNAELDFDLNEMLRQLTG